MSAPLCKHHLIQCFASDSCSNFCFNHLRAKFIAPGRQCILKNLFAIYFGSLLLLFPSLSHFRLPGCQTTAKKSRSIMGDSNSFPWVLVVLFFIERKWRLFFGSGSCGFYTW